MNATLYDVPGPWKGRLAIVPRPRGGDWLDEEIGALRSAGVGLLVSMLTPTEAAEFELNDEGALCLARGIDWISFPIVDRGVPASIEAMAEVVRRLERTLSQAKKVAIHCRAGIGRSSLLAACVLVSSGIGVDEAFGQVEASRGCPVPDTQEQREWVATFAKGVLGAAKRAAS
jgi:hypothetical protein